MCSRPEARTGRGARGKAAALFLGLALALLLALAAQAVERIQLSIADIRTPALRVQGVQFHFATGSVPPELRIAGLALGDRSWRDLRLSCSRTSVALEGLGCQRGELRIAGRRLPLSVDFRFDPFEATLEAGLAFASGSHVRLRYDGESLLEVSLVRFSAEDLTEFAAMLSPSIAAELSRHALEGVVDAQLAWQLPGGAHPHESLRLEARLSDGGFAAPDGLQAAEGLHVAVDLSARASPAGWDWQGRAAWEKGEAYLHPLYLQAGPVLNAEGTIDDERAVLRMATIEIEGVSQLAFSAGIARQPLALQDFALSLAGGDLAILGPRWITPVLAPALAERLRFAGHVGAGIEIKDGHLATLDLVFDEAGVSLAGVGPSGEAGGRGLAFGPLSGHLPWSAAAPTRARFQVQGGHWEALSLGAFEVEALLDGGHAAFEPIRIQLLDGALVLEGLALEREAAGWRGQGDVVVEPLSMALLTEALGWPGMSGILSASLPGMRVNSGEIALDGALVVSVFDGYLQATGLRVSEPFGVASHLRADIQARHLDLAQLTDTFSFGSITGYVDADVHGLELVRWRPAAFDMRLASSPGSYRRRISQRAVQNIGALGGGGAMAALQRGVLGVFDTFGYRELGLHCVLAGGVCIMDGVEGGERADGGFRIVRGGGIPALDVIGYNRRVDWNELVGRIQRVIEDNVAPELH
ncbi:hypothetical protein C666_02695 [Thauera linaloolentis 47Lol = DSM 12138]|uniref:Dicarboxylate transport domain-containing protein n=1 Tax=Thauera linaloolentis (strain DSM 12138 / JCM 21573 / CCUG 41526 / CIP 105981 / IAM 15112 / NBRC 102519 / 47Lol) TaxID=1123367 RepID=N6Y768_THAL4|nr:hypothetical protein C666_02695 [Thauera linaloolentis 47Lol = DSM 12138]